MGLKLETVGIKVPMPVEIWEAVNQLIVTSHHNVDVDDGRPSSAAAHLTSTRTTWISREYLRSPRSHI